MHARHLFDDKTCDCPHPWHDDTCPVEQQVIETDRCHVQIKITWYQWQMIEALVIGWQHD